jgi:hypothetical protein
MVALAGIGALAAVWLACSSSGDGSVSAADNAASECEQKGAKCYQVAGGCPGTSAPQPWTCPQAEGQMNTNKCCAIRDAGGQ